MGEFQETQEHFEIIGGAKLSGGRVPIAGSSNQVTKCIIASLLTTEDVLIKNAPCVNERYVVQNLFSFLGGNVIEKDEHTINLNAKDLAVHTIPDELCHKNRISIITVGPLLHRFGEASISAALGGDKIGQRPVDLHVSGLKAMGAIVELDGSRYHFKKPKEGLHGAHIRLSFPSVMTTEHLLMTAVLAKGRTIIENAAIEPEVIELVKMLQKMGADIMMDANRTFVIQGVEKLRGCALRCMLDRNQAVSFACAALATGGDVLLEDASHDSLYSFLNFIQRMGADFRSNSEGILVKAPNGKPLKGTHIEVDVHPGFMTDWQQPFMVLFTQAEGVSILHETVFENRLGYAKYLNNMGAKINLYTSCLGELPCRFKHKNYPHSAIIQGGTPLVAKNFHAPTDIRAAMCLIIAGLVAEGTTCLSNVDELRRKYDNLVPKLQSMGANIRLIGAKSA